MEQVLINLIGYLIDKHGVHILEHIIIKTKPGIEARVKSGTITLNKKIIKRIRFNKVDKSEDVSNYYDGGIETSYFVIIVNLYDDTNEEKIRFFYKKEGVTLRIEEEEDELSDLINRKLFPDHKFYDCEIQNLTYAEAQQCLDYLLSPDIEWGYFTHSIAY